MNQNIKKQSKANAHLLETSALSGLEWQPAFCQMTAYCQGAIIIISLATDWPVDFD